MINIVCKQFQAPLEKKDSEETNVIDLTCECEEDNLKADFVKVCLEGWIFNALCLSIDYI